MTTALNDFIPESVARRRELYTPCHIKVFSFHAFPFISQLFVFLSPVRCTRTCLSLPLSFAHISHLMHLLCCAYRIFIYIRYLSFL